VAEPFAAADPLRPPQAGELNHEEEPASFDVYVQWFRGGDADRVSTNELRRAFGTALVAEDGLGWRLSFGPDLKSDIYLSFDGEDTSRMRGVTLNRPSSAEAMWVALFNLLGLGTSVFFFPGGGMFGRSPHVRQHIPADMIEAPGEPQRIARPQDLVDPIESS